MSTKKTKVTIETSEKSSKQEGEFEGSLFSLFAAKKRIYQARIKGKYRTLKWLAMVPLLSIYYIFPWLRWERAGDAPDQAVMVDFTTRNIYFFGLEVWPQEMYLLTGLLMLAAFLLFFATALAGRVWCGYACPQTVWTDLFMIVERMLEGDRHRRMRLDASPWNFNKLWRKSVKHVLWVVIGLLTGGAWVLYFTDAPTFVADLLNGQIEFAAAFWILLLTASTYTLAGHAREHVCTYMCPYARFQGAMFDTDTLIVAYDEERGEPRGKASKSNNAGDCIDCGKCVAVCPTGIDIRNGQQYQCITCGLCIDACNTVMRKIGKAEGLIRYNTAGNALDGSETVFEAAKKLRIVRPRTLIYTFILVGVTAALIYAFTIGRMTVDMNVLRERNPLFITMANGDIRNVYTIRVVNKVMNDMNYTLSADGIKNASLTVRRHTTNEDGTVPITVKAGKVGTFRTFVEMPKGYAKGLRKPFNFVITSDQNADTSTTVFIGPK